MAGQRGWRRRHFLQAGALALTGMSLSDLLRLRAQAASASSGSGQPPAAASLKDTAVILLFVHGGPSHLETYDMKPDAPDTIRGPFSPIPTTVPGLDICEHLPLQAQQAHRYSLIRSVSHDEADHFAGHRRFLSGYGQLKPGFGYESYYPQVGAVVNRLFQGRVQGLLPAVSVGGVVVNGPDYAPGISEVYWSSTYRVPIVNGGLRDSTLLVESGQLDNRLGLLKGFDRLRRDLDDKGVMDSMDTFNQQAVEILLADRAREAFDLTREDPRLREKYGDGYGQEVLTARRLVEAGLSFVTVRIPGSGPGTKAYDWDDHAVNWDMLGAMHARLPKYDHVVSTLLDDLYARGLNERVLVLVTGEFGRTPRLEQRDGRIGRDHWPSAMSIMVAGGGMKMGQVIGSTNRYGEHPKERQLDPHDFLATIYRHLGINPQLEIPDPAGRPIPLCRGTPIHELF